MKSHLVIDGRSKNKLKAQEIGINTARSSYKEGLYHQGIMFSWDRDPVMLEMVLEQIDYSYINKPRNLDELRSIAREACLTEYEILKANHKGELPIEAYTDEDMIFLLTECSTEAVKIGLPVDFYHALKDRKVKDIDNTWKNIFIQEYSLDKVRKYALDHFESKLWNKRFTPAIQEAAFFEINQYWSKVKDIQEVVNSYS
jgi:hypothetical protein